jgi:hypothetical protein
MELLLFHLLECDQEARSKTTNQRRSSISHSEMPSTSLPLRHHLHGHHCASIYDIEQAIQE